MNASKHGHSAGGKPSPTYSSWASMRARRENSKHTHFDRYGGRGIKVCERWVKFENFLTDMGERPSLKYSIDRFPNNDGNYEPGNCRWATRQEQMWSRTVGLVVDFRGQRSRLCDLADQFGFDRIVVYQRMARGWSVEESLTTPLVKHQKLFGRQRARGPALARSA